MIKQYNAYGVSATRKPFVMNQTYTLEQPKEANLFDNIASEWYYLHGSDIIFLPREVNKEETTFGEYLSAVYNQGIPIRMFIEETEAWSGNGDMYSKFGLQVTDECTLYINKTSFANATNGMSLSVSALGTITVTGSSSQIYPKQGDLIYVVKSKKLFQISHIEDEVQPAFYLLGNRAGYKIQCKLFMYNHEVINQSASAGIPEAIQALDSLLDDLEGNNVPIETKEYNQHNANIIKTALPVINNTEIDPLFG